MEIELENIIIFVNILTCLFIIIYSTIAAKRLKGGPLFWTPFMFIFFGILYALHAIVEVFDLGIDFYALTSLLATVSIIIIVLIINITHDLMNKVKSDA